jgi:hypothetical protein
MPYLANVIWNDLWLSQISVEKLADPDLALISSADKCLTSTGHVKMSVVAMTDLVASKHAVHQQPVSGKHSNCPFYSPSSSKSTECRIRIGEPGGKQARGEAGPIIIASQTQEVEAKDLWDYSNSACRSYVVEVKKFSFCSKMRSSNRNIIILSFRGV